MSGTVSVYRNSRSAMTFARAAIVLLLASLVIAACSGFGGPKRAAVAVDPNAYPADYRNQVVALLRMTLKDRSDFQTALIAPPALKPVPQGTAPHYVVCLRFPKRSEHQDKVVVYLEGAPNEFVDATPQECGDAVYQPFGELAGAMPHG